MSEIDITGIDKGELLAALYNNSSPRGMGFLQARRADMSKDDAAKIVKEATRPSGKAIFDYVYGRPIKVWFEGDKLTGARLYDRDNGHGACERIVAELRSSLTSSEVPK